MSGALWFGINDDYVSGGAYDNGGSLTATISCSRCPVKELTPYTPDPYPLNTDSLTPAMKTGLACLMGCAGQSSIPAFLSSAYRPPAYQLHLRDVYLKWSELKKNTLPECAALKAQVKDEFFNRHQLGTSTQEPPANPNNCHSTGDCVDLNSPFREAVDFCSAECRAYRPWPESDPNHVVSY